MKDISHEIPNDFDPNLCEKCAMKERFRNRSNKAMDNKQKTLFDGFKH
jgi:hypothetical protein